ncbi:MAG: ABC transporter permease [Nitrospiraceae bacterium]|nr:ABC transporter permease [Nitrospiraceae bacterium]
MADSFTIFSFAARNLRRKPLRTAVLIASIGLLVTALVFVLSFVRRVDSVVKVASDRLGADVIIVPSGSRGAAEDVLLENKVKTFYMDKALVEKIGRINGIDALTYQTYLASIVGQCCDVPETVVVAFNQDTDFIIKPWLGKAFGRRLKKGEALVGNESAMNISVGLTEVDGVLFGNLFKMVGVLEKTGTGLDTAIFIDESNIEDILTKGKTALKSGQVSIIFARVKKGFDPSKVAGDIGDAFVEVNAVARKDIGRNILSTLRDLNRVFFVTVTLAAVLSIFLVWAVFSAIANERSWEIGIMRAIGARESHVSRLFLIEVLFIGAAGSFIGIIAGTAVSVFLGKHFMMLKNVTADLGTGERIIIGLCSLAAGTAICVAGALSPVRRLKKLEPLLAIRKD